MSIDKIGLMNVHWGICGFTSALYALHTHTPGRRAELEAGGESPTKVLAEIKTYLRMLQADGRQDILDSIEAFTQTFPGFDSWTITSYIERVNAVVINGANLDDPFFGIGMPPSAVVDYMKRVCNFNNPRIIDNSGNAPEMILGMGTDFHKMTMYGGLGHYLYSYRYKIYSWGLEFADPFQAMDGECGGVPASQWRISCKIAL